MQMLDTFLLQPMSAKKAKAARRKAATPDPALQTTRQGARRAPSWPMLAIRVLGALGLVLGVYLSLLHYQAGASGSIGSALCGSGTTVNCSLVLSSAYAMLFEVPVAMLAAGTYAALLASTFLAPPGLTVLLCGWMFVFSLYMAAISFFTIGAVCPVCTGLYVVNLGLLVSAVAQARADQTLTRPRLASASLGFAVGLLGIGLTQAENAASVTPLQEYLAPSPAEMDQSFVRYYYDQPAVVLRGSERHVEGPADAVLTIHEFVDFRCPQCARARDTLLKFQRANPNDVRVVFRHYPLDQQCNTSMKGQVHPGACGASMAAECAAEQGKFWEYADLLFAEQTKFKRTDFDAHARTARLDFEQFCACMDDGRTEALVKNDIDEALRLGVEATPTLVVNGRLIRGLPPVHKLASLVTLQKQPDTSATP